MTDKQDSGEEDTSLSCEADRSRGRDSLPRKSGPSPCLPACDPEVSPLTASQTQARPAQLMGFEFGGLLDEAALALGDISD